MRKGAYHSGLGTEPRSPHPIRRTLPVHSDSSMTLAPWSSGSAVAARGGQIMVVVLNPLVGEGGRREESKVEIGCAGAALHLVSYGNLYIRRALSVRCDLTSRGGRWLPPPLQVGTAPRQRPGDLPGRLQGGGGAPLIQSSRRLPCGRQWRTHLLVVVVVV